MEDKQQLFNIIAILTRKLGGEVKITQEELVNVPPAEAQRDHTGDLIIKTFKKED